MQFYRQLISSAAGLQVRKMVGPAQTGLCLEANEQSRRKTAVTAAVVDEKKETLPSTNFVSPIAVTSIDESQYGQQLQAKLFKLKELFQEFSPPELEVFESPPSHYRMRAEFTIGQRNGEFQYLMFDKSSVLPNTSSPPGNDGDANALAEGDAATASPSTSADAAAPPRGNDIAGGGGGRRKGPRQVVVETFPVASRQVNELMEVVRQECSQCPELRNRLFQVNFHSTLAGDAMVTLLYHRRIGPEWNVAAERLRDALAATPVAAAAGRRPHIIGRSRRQKVELQADFVLERLRVGGREYLQKQVEGAFSQPNGAVCQHMLGWALDVTKSAPPRRVRARRGNGGSSSDGGRGEGGVEIASAVAAFEMAAAANEGKEGQMGNGGDRGGSNDGSDGSGRGGATRGGADGEQDEEEAERRPTDDLLELYCGNGNFTVPLAQNFRRVVATEVSKSSVEAARYNLEANGVTNVFIARMASEEFAETMRARGTRRRLQDLGSWEELNLRTILVDPPRAGLDKFTVELLKEFDRIVYISCNPETLHANLRAIVPTHQIARFAAFDQFPYTHHLECGVYLTRR